jgi:purine-nucleoside/S-methyl-5'-thioadenosine phosphorylase / adenosine deaminase
VFASRHTREGTVDIAFTDRWGGVADGSFATLDLTRQRAGASAELATNWSLVAEAFDVDGFVSMRQVHGSRVTTVRSLDIEPLTCDGLVTDTPGVALCVRVGDCVPLVLADVNAGVVGVAHAGRPGVTAGVVPATVQAMNDLGADHIEAWVGPHVCGGCYEVPAVMRDEVARVEPAAFACTTWGTPSVDIGAAVVAQLRRAGCSAVNETAACTMESSDFFSYRRQGAASGRQAGLVVLRRRAGDPQGAQ